MERVDRRGFLKEIIFGVCGVSGVIVGKLTVDGQNFEQNTLLSKKLHDLDTQVTGQGLLLKSVVDTQLNTEHLREGLDEVAKFELLLEKRLKRLESWAKSANQSVLFLGGDR